MRMAAILEKMGEYNSQGLAQLLPQTHEPFPPPPPKPSILKNWFLLSHFTCMSDDLSHNNLSSFLSKVPGADLLHHGSHIRCWTSSWTLRPTGYRRPGAVSSALSLQQSSTVHQTTMKTIFLSLHKSLPHYPSQNNCSAASQGGPTHSQVCSLEYGRYYHAAWPSLGL